MTINLARKWRSKTFSEIVGQPLAVRVIKNSLYRQLLFPVYLLSGTRGTGKTSTARIFAAALNCAQLSAFQKDPTAHELPCLSCESCRAFQQMNHPDIIEIDAASHTGVDNVRQIIEAASLVPVLGGKKVYLIDEAHMLSKAAFNAFLKILEEPPATVVFMLITTDPHKIIPTVQSRSFQIFFEPIAHADVVTHLTQVCAQEAIAIDPQALALIAQETHGCMRDALNMLERVRALGAEQTQDMIMQETVQKMLGLIDDDRIVQLLSAVLEDDAQRVLAVWHEGEFTKFAPLIVLKKIIETLRRALWLAHDVAPDDIPATEDLLRLAKCASYKHLTRLLTVCYDYELTFLKTSSPQTLLELVLMTMVGVSDHGSAVVEPAAVVKKQITVPPKKIPLKAEVAPGAKPVEKPVQPKLAGPPASALVQEKRQEKTVSPAASVSPAPPVRDKKEHVAVQEVSSPDKPESKELPPQVSQSEALVDGPWGECMQALEGISDPLVLSIFKQSTIPVHDKDAGTLTISFSQDLAFFKDWLSSTEKVWHPIIAQFYGAVTLVSVFDGPSTKQRPVVMESVKAPESLPVQDKEASQPAQKRQVKTTQEPRGKSVSTKQVAELKVGAAVADVFAGTMTVQDTKSDGNS